MMMMMMMMMMIIIIIIIKVTTIFTLTFSNLSITPKHNYFFLWFAQISLKLSPQIKCRIFWLGNTNRLLIVAARINTHCLES
jgi:hypothetical protein